MHGAGKPALQIHSVVALPFSANLELVLPPGWVLSAPHMHGIGMLLPWVMLLHPAASPGYSMLWVCSEQGQAEAKSLGVPLEQCHVLSPHPCPSVIRLLHTPGLPLLRDGLGGSRVFPALGFPPARPIPAGSSPVSVISAGNEAVGQMEPRAARGDREQSRC